MPISGPAMARRSQARRPRHTPLAASDVGHTLTAIVTATGPGGSASVTSAPTVPIVAAASSGSGTSGSFVALHTYYLSPTGSDSNNGTSATACGTNCGPWLTPKHNVVCGDVIIAAAGNYNSASSHFGANNWGTVSSCPSTSGGIDGNGGVYFATLLCAGPYLTSCPVTATASEDFRVDASNWAVEGFWGTSSNQACFAATSETSTTLHHVAFINDIGSGCQNAAFDTYPWNGTGTSSFDQTAVVGVIAYNASRTSSLCGSGISVIPTDGPDSSTGTHVYIAGAFSYANVNGVGCSGSGQTTDGEGIIFDSWGLQRYTYPGVVEQNVMWRNGSSGFEIFPNGGRTRRPITPSTIRHGVIFKTRIILETLEESCCSRGFFQPCRRSNLRRITSSSPLCRRRAPQLRPAILAAAFMGRRSVVPATASILGSL